MEERRLLDRKMPSKKELVDAFVRRLEEGQHEVFMLNVRRKGTRCRLMGGTTTVVAGAHVFGCCWKLVCDMTPYLQLKQLKPVEQLKSREHAGKEPSLRSGLSRSFAARPKYIQFVL